MPEPLDVATVELRPDFSGFGRELKTGLDNAFRGVSSSVNSAMNKVEREVRDAADAVSTEFRKEGEKAEKSFDEISDAAKREFNKVDRHADDALGKTRGRFKGFALAAVGALATIGLGAGITSAISQASDLGESINAVSVIMGEGSDSFIKFGETAAGQLGITQSALNEAIVPTAALLQQAGSGGEVLSGQLQDLASRATDVGSVFNTDVNEVLNAMGAALRGETEPIRRFGVSLNDAALRAKAVELGLADSTAEVTQAAKTQAAYALIMEQTSKSQGDFQNTIESLPNMMRVFKATVGEAAAELGTALLPAATELASAALPAILDIATALAPVFVSLGAIIAELAPVFGEIAGIVGEALVEGLDAILPAIKPLADAFSTFIQVLAPILPLVGRIIGTLLPPLAEILTVVFTAMQPLIDVFIEFITDVLEELQPILPDISSLITALAEALAGVLGQALALLLPLLLQLIKAILPILPPVLKLAELIIALLVPALELLMVPFSAIITVIIEFATVIAKALSTAVTWVANFVKNVARHWDEFIAKVEKIWTSVTTTIGDAWNSIIRFFEDAWENITGFVEDGWISIQDFFTDGVRWVANRMLDFVEFILDGVEAAFGWAPVIGDKIRAAQGKVNDFRDDVNSALRGIKDRNAKVSVSISSNAGALAADVRARWTGMARGGPVFGEGGPTADRVPALLSNDEHVWTAKEVQAAGGHGNVMLLRQAMLNAASGGAKRIRGMIRGFAAGGPAGVNLGATVPGVSPNMFKNVNDAFTDYTGSLSQFVAARLKSTIAKAIGRAGWAIPLPRGSYSVGSPFGPRSGGFHSGQDLPAARGTRVLAAASGVVSRAMRMFTSYGVHAFINHARGYQTRYAHMMDLVVRAGQSIMRGQTLGHVDSTGNSTGNHLHFEIRQNGLALNPRSLIRFDDGYGTIPPGLSLTYNGTGGPETLERVESPGERRGRGGMSIENLNISVLGQPLTLTQIQNELALMGAH